MTFNLLLWKWSDDYDTPGKRKRHRIKFSDITSQFVEAGDHPAIGPADIDGFIDALGGAFGLDEDQRPFVLERHTNCAVINYANALRFELVPKVAGIGKRFGLNASEF